MTKLSKAQIKVLRQALRDGGEICLTGADRTEPRPRRDVVDRLVDLGLLRVAASPHLHIPQGDYFRTTPEAEGAFSDD